MKYIKKYESVGWQDFISILSNAQFKKRITRRSQKFIDLTDKEKSSILNLLKSIKVPGKVFPIVDCGITADFNFRVTKDGDKMSRVSHHNSDILIYKSDHDEWYYGLFGKDLIDPRISNFHPFYLSDHQGVKKRFECDQFDGLLRMISEFIEAINRKYEKV